MLMKGSLHTDADARSGPGQGHRPRHRAADQPRLHDGRPGLPRILFLTDAAINISPDLEDKARYVQNAIDLAQVLGIETPKVAILSAVETVNPKLRPPSRRRPCARWPTAGQITGGVVDGPLAFDNAIPQEAAEVKGIVSAVAGEADILVVPDLEAGNMLVKQLEYLANADTAGIVLGARVPIVADQPRGQAAEPDGVLRRSPSWWPRHERDIGRYDKGPDSRGER